MPPTALAIRKLADKSAGERVKRYDPISGDAYLADPETWSADDPATHVATPWPLVGIEMVESPKDAIIPTSFVDRGLAEGWLSLEGGEMVHRAGGPPDAPWRVTHSFKHADAIVLHCVDGDVRYRVTQNPDKWPDSKSELDEGFGGEVRWFYLGRLDG